MTQVPMAMVDVSMFNVSDCYPESFITDAIEERIAASLPTVPGLVPGLSTEARLAVFEASISNARQAHIIKYGGPYSTVEVSVNSSSSVSGPTIVEKLDLVTSGACTSSA